MPILPFSINPLRKKTPDEINSYEVIINMSQTFIKKVKRLSPTSAKFYFDVKKPFHCNVKFKTFELESLKSHFNGNNFKFKKFYVIADFEKEDIAYLSEATKKEKEGFFKKMGRKIRLNKLFKKIKLANKGQNYSNKRGKSEISFLWGGRHFQKFIPLPKEVNLHCNVDFSRNFEISIGNCRAMHEKDLKSKKQNQIYFKSPELAIAIWKAMKNKVFGKEISEEIVNNKNISGKEKPMKHIKVKSLKEKKNCGRKGLPLKMDEAEEKIKSSTFNDLIERFNKIEKEIKDFKDNLEKYRKESETISEEKCEDKKCEEDHLNEEVEEKVKDEIEVEDEMNDESIKDRRFRKNFFESKKSAKAYRQDAVFQKNLGRFIAETQRHYV